VVGRGHGRRAGARLGHLRRGKSLAHTLRGRAASAREVLREPPLHLPVDQRHRGLWGQHGIQGEGGHLLRRWLHSAEEVGDRVGSEGGGGGR